MDRVELNLTKKKLQGNGNQKRSDKAVFIALVSRSTVVQMVHAINPERKAENQHLVGCTIQRKKIHLNEFTSRSSAILSRFTELSAEQSLPTRLKIVTVTATRTGVLTKFGVCTVENGTVRHIHEGKPVRVDINHRQPLRRVHISWLNAS